MQRLPEINRRYEACSWLRRSVSCLISESHFTKLTVLKIPHYNVYNTPHPDGTAHGGTTLIIRKTISHYELPPYQTAKIQATIVKIKTVHWRFSVAAIYSSPRHSISTGEYRGVFFKLLATDSLLGETGTRNIHTGAPD